MKNLMILSIALALGFTAFGQQIKKEVVPATVNAKFASLYPNMNNVNWSKENGNFKAEFNSNKFETSVTFDATGNLIKTEIELAVTEMPSKIKEYFTVNVPGGTVTKFSKIIYDKGVLNYEVVDNGVDYILDQNGKLITKVKAMPKNSDEK